MAPRLDEHGIPGQLVLTAAQDLLANDTSVRAGLTRRRLVRLTELTVEVTDAQTTDPHDRAPAPMDLGFLMAASLRPSIDTIHMFDTTPHVKPGKAAPPTPDEALRSVAPAVHDWLSSDSSSTGSQNVLRKRADRLSVMGQGGAWPLPRPIPRI